jgi:hypothetical protein
MTDEQKRRVAVLMGMIAGLHAEGKRLEAEGVEEMDMFCCQMEDTFTVLEPLLSDLTQTEAFAEYR